MKTLKVISARDLPIATDRDPNVIYFLYDKLEIYVGQNLFTDPYIVADYEPWYPLYGAMYFILETGDVIIYSDLEMDIIAHVETPEMLELLKLQGGTYFFVNADKRYLDKQRRIITLPYRNGVWDLTVSMACNIRIDENTVIAYNPETNCFDIIGKREDYDLVFTSKYRGSETDSAITTVDDGVISVDVKISAQPGNILKYLDDGLGAYAPNKVTSEEFNALKGSYEEFKTELDAGLTRAEAILEELESELTPEAINQKVHDQLEIRYPEIDATLAGLQDFINELDGIKAQAQQYTDNEFASALVTIEGYLQGSPWQYMGDIVV